MGTILEDFGKMGVEVRRESFIIHPSYGYKGKDDDEHDDSEPWKTAWREGPHPEFMLEDLDDLIAALQDAKRYVERRGPKLTAQDGEEWGVYRTCKSKGVAVDRVLDKPPPVFDGWIMAEQLTPVSTTREGAETLARRLNDNAEQRKRGMSYEARPLPPRVRP